MTKNISIILGSGFSVPDGMNTVGQINDLIKSLEETNITISSDMQLSYLPDNKSSFPRTIHWNDSMFFVHFIKWYIKNITTEFNYEEFYDFFTSFRISKNNSLIIETFFKDFKKNIIQSNDSVDRIASYMSRFSEYFNQLLALILQSSKYYENVTLVNYPPYDHFAKFIGDLAKQGFIVNNHSLNHDLLFEHLASKHSYLLGYFSDGFTDLGSIYYGNVKFEQSISKTYKVRLKYFKNEYDNKPIRLFKLHGSVDTFIANLEVQNMDLTRVKKDWGVIEIQKEIITETGQKTYSDTYQSTHPDILSGTKSKIKRYNESYYKELQGHFVSNLNKSCLLIVIGYGFKDDGVNRVIEEEFLKYNKKMIVIDVKTPSSNLLKDYNVTLIEKSIAEIKFDEWQTILNK